jgi:NAD+ synthase (glutamine-hydrolysing)
VHIYPELYLTGYPLQDLCLQKSFIDSYQKHLNELNDHVKKHKGHGLFLVGGIHYELSKAGLPISLKNVIYKIEPGKEIEAIYAKRLLPNYDIFDEKKYFTSGTESCVIEYEGENLALLICEDMWSSNFHKLDPVKDLYEKCLGQNISAIINLSASPYYIDKPQKRLARASFISELFHAPFIYCNRVGSEDEIIFDGGSFAVHGENLLVKAKSFNEDIVSINYQNNEEIIDEDESPQHSQHLGRAILVPELPLIMSWHLNQFSDDQCLEIINASHLWGARICYRNLVLKNLLLLCLVEWILHLVLTLIRTLFKRGTKLRSDLYAKPILESSLI